MTCYSVLFPSSVCVEHYGLLLLIVHELHYEAADHAQGVQRERGERLDVRPHQRKLDEVTNHHRHTGEPDMERKHVDRVGAGTGAPR